jgi:lysozyme
LFSYASNEDNIEGRMQLEKLSRLRAVIIAGATFVGCASYSSNAQTDQKPKSQDVRVAELTESDWIPLSNDPSRAAIFSMMKDAKVRKLKSTRTGQEQLQAFPFEGYFVFPDDVTYDDIAHRPRTGYLFGIDVSHYTNPDLDFRVLKQQGIDWVYIKATQGKSFKDGNFSKFWGTLGALDRSRAVYRGAYHFLVPGIDGKEQADRFLAYINLHGGLRNDDLPPCVDLEMTSESHDGWQVYDPDSIVDVTLAWLKRIEEKTGRKPMVYTLKSWWSSVTKRHGAKANAFARLSDYKIWIADASLNDRLNEKPAVILNREWDLWQFSSTSRLTDGYPSDLSLDVSVFKGTIEDFRRSFGLTQRIGPASSGP